MQYDIMYLCSAVGDQQKIAQKGDAQKPRTQTLQTEIAATTVYSLNVLQPIK